MLCANACKQGALIQPIPAVFLQHFVPLGAAFLFGWGWAAGVAGQELDDDVVVGGLGKLGDLAHDAAVGDLLGADAYQQLHGLGGEFGNQVDELGALNDAAFVCPVLPENVAVPVVGGIGGF